jgi:hypothetical protein
MSTFPQYTYNQLLFEVPLGEVYAMYSWATANDPINRFGGINMINGGYLGREADVLYTELKEIMKKS